MKTREQDKEPTEEETRELAMFIKGSLKWRMAHTGVRVLMVFEGIVWSIMDWLRAKRMRLTARINRNYKNRV